MQVTSDESLLSIGSDQSMLNAYFNIGLRVDLFCKDELGIDCGRMEQSRRSDYDGAESHTHHRYFY